jgi:hypothetical protein
MESGRQDEEQGGAASRFRRAIVRKQTTRLDALTHAAAAARPAAERGELFASKAGQCLVNAAFDLFECDGLYALGQDVGHELDRGPE